MVAEHVKSCPLSYRSVNLSKWGIREHLNLSRRFRSRTSVPGSSCALKCHLYCEPWILAGILTDDEQRQSTPIALFCRCQHADQYRVPSSSCLRPNSIALDPLSRSWCRTLLPFFRSLRNGRVKIIFRRWDPIQQPSHIDQNQTPTTLHTALIFLFLFYLFTGLFFLSGQIAFTVFVIISLSPAHHYS